ncbi:MAG: arsenic metallochaperone ArsD family protein [Rhodocyclaceae bacterium]|jgi:hypothetical protein|nr:arsenic metallochaperone ArsD family protein [Rhodocyclaceae bacterium]MCL4758612.1 arsenic metallochaperone ArsD family protein [Rhodocyclaceae bacterium]
MEKSVKKIQVFDSAQPTGSGADAGNLAVFADDLAWVAQQGYVVERFNHGLQPLAFAGNPIVKRELDSAGEAALPLIVLNGELALSGRYPNRDELARWMNGAPVPASECCSGGRCC